MRPAHRRFLVLCVSVVAALFPISGRAGGAGPDPRQVQIPHPGEAREVVMALSGAYRKLARPRCQQILDDFRDDEGRTLREHLALTPSVAEPAEYLSLLTYRDGRELHSGRCRSGDAAAVTHVGDRVVYICIASFREQRPGIRENTLIHEMLHSLGLRENPPSTTEINGQVLRRCGS